MSKIEKIIVSHNALLEAGFSILDNMDSEDAKKFRDLFEKHELETRQQKRATLETRAITSRKTGQVYDNVQIHFPASPEKIGRPDLMRQIESANAGQQYPVWRHYEPNDTWSANQTTENLIFGSQLVESYNKTVEGQVVDPIAR